MTNVVVVGSQWGDEGKGKIVDWLSEQADVVIRFQGGHRLIGSSSINYLRKKLLPFALIVTPKILREWANYICTSVIGMENNY